MSDSFKSVIFDIDNTLYDFAYCNGLALDKLREYAYKNFAWTAETFNESHLAAQREIFSQMGYNGSCRSRILRYKKMLERSNLPLFPHAVEMVELYWSTMLENLRPYDEVFDVISTLKSHKIRIGVGSDMTTYIQFKKLEKMNILQFIDFIVTSEEAGEEKPSAKIFQLCLDKAGCSKSECLFVGDDLRKDYEGAKNFGMSALLVNRKNNQLSGDIQQISSLTQILEIIN